MDIQAPFYYMNNKNNLNNQELNEQKLLKYALDNGMINLSYVQDVIDMKKRKEILEQHPYKIWEGKDGKWRTYIIDENGNRTMKKRSTKDGIENTVIDYYKSIEDKIKTDYSFRSYWEKFKEKQISYGVSNNTLTKYNSDYRRFFCGTEFEKKDIRFINEEEITAFMIQSIKMLNLKERAGKALLGYINGVFKHARICRVIKENPCEYVEHKYFFKLYDRSKKTTEERTVCQTDFELLLNQIHISQNQKPSYIPNYAVELAAYTGMRIGEIVALKWEDIREDIGVICIRRSEKFDRITREYYIDDTKTDKERQFPISEKIQFLLHKIKKIEIQYGFLGEFVFQNENGKLHASSVAHCVRYKCIQAGIHEKSIHALRRTLNSKLRCAGVSSVIASSMLGHTEEVNEENYTYDISGMDYKREVISKII